jgi:hypothetical protein
MGAVFALASGAPDVATASVGAAAAGTRVTFAVAAGLIVGALALAAGSRVRRAVSVAVLLLVRATPGRGQAPAPSEDSYPAAAAGWGPPAGRGLFVSRWAEDWAGARAAGAAPPFKAMPLGGDASLTVGAEVRLRHDAFANAQLTEGNDYRQTLLRGALGADVRLDRRLRVYGEVATGQIGGRRRVAPPNFQNDASVQQLFVDARGHAGAMLLGAMVGRQEFADGPRQLVSLSDGPNVHRTWNGVRLYAHARRFRLGAFDLRVTRQARGAFDEAVDRAERLRGFNGSLLVAHGPAGANVYLDPFWIHSEHPAFRSGGRIGPDERDTFGARLWGRRGTVAFDWTLARQTGRSQQRGVGAWGLFAVQSLALSGQGWRPRLDLRADVASGGGTRETGRLAQFNPLYASSAYLGEGQFLGLANLLTVAPGLSVSPTPRTGLSLEYALARRLARGDAVRAGGMRAYEGTQNIPGRAIGGVLRVAGTRLVGERVTLFFTHEHLVAGDVLDRAGLPSGSYGHIGATLRY